MKISVIGAGSWGTALAQIIATNGHNVTLWGRNQKNIEEMAISKENKKYLPNIKLSELIKFTSDLGEAADRADVLILGVPSQVTRGVLKDLKQYELSKAIFVNVSKGIEIGSLKRISEVVSEFYPDNEYVVLSGPSHAEEASNGIPTTLISASKNRETAELIQDIFTTDTVRVYTNPDIIGVELGGALKNIIALGAGIGDGLGFGDNSKAAIMTRGIFEITKLGHAMGADTSTFNGLSGIGDLIVTCTSMHSRNRRFGILIGKGYSVEDALKEIAMVVEGYYTIKSAYDLSIKYNVDMPITKELYKVLYEGDSARDSVKNLMMRKKKHEMEEAAYIMNTWE